MLFFMGRRVGREIQTFPKSICLNSQCLEQSCEMGPESQAGAEDLGRAVSPINQAAPNLQMCEVEFFSGIAG